MPKVTVVQVIYNSKKFIEPVFSAIFAQTFKDFNVVAVISGNADGGKELLMEKFPAVEIIDPGYNIGFAAGHNLVFDRYCNLSSNFASNFAKASSDKKTSSDKPALPLKVEGATEFFQLVNPDMIMEPNYIEEMLKAFEDPKVGATSGKLYQADRKQIENWNSSLKSYILNHKLLDTTGVFISKSGRARDRGQHEVDKGQYDSLVEVDAVSGAGCMYRASALKSVKMQKSGLPTTSYPLPTSEYFDEDFHSYWEDVDLAWRMKNAGWKNIFVPSAVGYHGRGAGSSEDGYINVIGFIKHHKKLSPRIRQLNYKNHIFMYIKNSPYFYPQFFIREFFMLGYVILSEISTLKILPKFFKLLPRMWKKRKEIFRNTIVISANR